MPPLTVNLPSLGDLKKPALKLGLVAGLVGALLYTGVVRVDLGRDAGPAPAPDNLAGVTAAGKAYAAPLVVAKAQALRQAAAAIRQGKSVPEAQAIDDASFKAHRQGAFDAKVRASLEAVVPSLSDLGPVGSPAREKMALALEAIAHGLDPADTPPDPRGPPAPPAPPAPGSPQIVGAAAGPQFGWVDAPAQREALARQLPARTFTLAAPGAVGADEPEAVFLYKAWQEVLGEFPHYPAQQTGDCTSFGTAHALDLGQCVELALVGGDKSGYRETSSEVIYGIGREIAGMLHRGGGADGCYGGAVAKAVTQFGTLPRETVGPYSGQRAKSFGYNGVPADLKQKAAAFKVGGATLVTTTAEAKSALANGYPFIVCSNQGFTLQRDANGVCRPSGSWPHCMFVSAYRQFNGHLQFNICNSWGDQLPTGPKTDGQPDFSFWVEAPVLQSMLRAEDSLAFSKFPEFVKRPLPNRWTWSGFAEPEPKPAVVDPDAKALVLPFKRQALPASLISHRKAG